VPELLEAVGYWFPIYVKSTVRTPSRPAYDNAAIYLSALNTRAFPSLNAPRLQPYGKVLSSAGNSLKEILTNINTMHGHIKMGYFSEVHASLFLRSTLPSRHGPPPRAPLALLACSIYFYFIYTNIIGKKKTTSCDHPRSG